MTTRGMKAMEDKVREGDRLGKWGEMRRFETTESVSEDEMRLLTSHSIPSREALTDTDCPLLGMSPKY